MSQDDLFNLIDNAPPADDGQGPAPNAPSEFSVSEISQKLKSVVEDQFSYVRVRGELSRVTVAKSGHVYTALKDENASLDAICWRGTAGRLSITPEEGLDVIVTGRLTTYPGRSNYQIIIESMELAGEGALLKMLEDRRKKLAAEGLFDDARKRPIPYIPNRIGVITSPTGAVIRDIMHRLMDRFPRPVYLWPAVVQGDQAAAQIIAGVQGFNALPDDSPYRPDVLIVARGGGWLEDLMPFNSEEIVRYIFASKIPVVTGIGHEDDNTLSDYVADKRGLTPTGAAQIISPDINDLRVEINRSSLNMQKTVKYYLEFKFPEIEKIKINLENIYPRKIEILIRNIDQLEFNLNNKLSDYVNITLNKLGNLKHSISVFNINEMSKKGYALVENQKKKIIKSINQVEKGEKLKILLSDGILSSKVENKIKE